MHFNENLSIYNSTNKKEKNWYYYLSYDALLISEADTIRSYAIAVCFFLLLYRVCLY